MGFVSVVNYDLLGLTEMIERSVMAPSDDDYTMSPSKPDRSECVDDKKKKFNYRRATYKSNGDIKQYSKWDKRKNKRCAILAKEDLVTISEACAKDVFFVCVK